MTSYSKNKEFVHRGTSKLETYEDEKNHFNVYSNDADVCCNGAVREIKKGR